MADLKSELSKISLPPEEHPPEGSVEETSVTQRVREYLEKRDVGTIFTMPALCAALGVPIEEANTRAVIGTALWRASKKGYLKEIARHANIPTYRLDKDGDWGKSPSTPARAISQAVPIAEQVRQLLKGWPVGSHFRGIEVAQHCGHRPATPEYKSVVTALWAGVQDGWIRSLGNASFELLGHPASGGRVYDVDTSPVTPHVTREKIDPPVAPVPPEAAPKTYGGPLIKALDPDLQITVNELLRMAEDIAGISPPEPAKGLDDYTMDELLDAIALKRMGGK